MADKAEAARSDNPARTSKTPYSAFISYSRAVDGKLAPALARALQGFAKPWYQRRSLRIFRDDDSLSANPSLWASIQDGLDGSEFFILLASPEAACSPWVEKEAAYWLVRRSSINMLIVVTDGAIAWSHEDGDFDSERTTCLPSALYGTFREEPRWVDLRAARDEQHLSVRLPMFRDRVADLAAALRHQLKDEIIGEDLHQYRRTRRFVVSTIALLSIITLVAVIAGVVAVNRTRAADEQRQIAEDRLHSTIARRLATQAVDSVSRDPRTALRLALAAQQIHPGPGSQASLYQTLTATAFAGKLPGRSYSRTIFPDSAAIVTSADDVVTIWDIQSTPPTKLTSFAAVGTPVVSPDGQTLLTANLDLNAKDQTWQLWDVHDRTHPTKIGPPQHFAYFGGDPPVFSPGGHLLAIQEDSGVQLWDITDRERPQLRHSIGVGVRSLAFAPDGRTLAVGSGEELGPKADMVVGLWDITRPVSPVRLSTKSYESGGYVESLEFSRDGNLLIASGSGPQGDTNVATILIDVTNRLRPNQLGPPIWGRDSPRMTAALSPTTAMLATSADEQEWSRYVPDLPYRKTCPD